jgi:hypothetical protein
LAGVAAVGRGLAAALVAVLVEALVADLDSEASAAGFSAAGFSAALDDLRADAVAISSIRTWVRADRCPVRRR